MNPADEHINEKGIKYYNDLIDLLLDNTITPVVTLYHWDLPQVLQEKYGGWQNESMVSYFNDFGDLCFERFGNRVKHWITFNNPWSISVEGYETGEHAPGLKLRGTGAYKAAHHIIKVGFTEMATQVSDSGPKVGVIHFGLTDRLGCAVRCAAQQTSQL
ncbi:hypothetical protein CHARACLAT_033208 [Characodon lateralis]|uniref:Uncharacterized protein n=1 Tax=Characodon lateralis TaxID=208331 RepID=A0ABU7EEY1_9TELE|nr:hypothetical protein [Characodon lateralis]